MGEPWDEPYASADGGPAAARPSEIVVAAGKVAAIVDAAEQAARDLRQNAERRARDRIVEADRAADLRVAAAEEEADEILAGARAGAASAQDEAHAAVADIHAHAARVRDEAEQLRVTTSAATRAKLEQLTEEAEAQVTRTRASAHAEARATLDVAHRAAGEVVREGERLSENLRALAQSLVRNADLIMRDVKAAHAELSAQLESAAPHPEPGGGGPASTLLPGDPPLAGEPVRRPPSHEDRTPWRPRRGDSRPLPASISELLEPEDATFDVPEFVQAPRRRTR